MNRKTLTFQIEAGDAGTRLDRCLSRLIPGESRSFLQRLIRDGLVKADGVALEVPRYPVRAGMSIAVELPEGRETREPDEEALDTETSDTALFYLKERDGYLAIYREDGTTLYETTDIPLSLLPEALQQEIRAGKSVESEQALYDFLENYSS